MMKKYNSIFLSWPAWVTITSMIIYFFGSFPAFPQAAQEKNPDTAQKEEPQKKPSASQESTSELEKASPFRVYLHSNRTFFYEGDPIDIEITLANDSQDVLENPVDPPLARSFILIDDEGHQLKPDIPQEAPQEAHPTPLIPQFYYGLLIDVTKHFPILLHPGKYQLKWKSGEIESEELPINVIRRYDPEKDYYAVVDTDLGRFKLDFFKKEAPIAVKAFIDFANGGFYDGQIFYQVKPADYVMAGDPKGDGTGSSGLPFIAEYNDIPVVTGTVVMVPFLGAPSRNDGKFLINLRPRPEKTGFLTVFAQVTEGLDVVKKISTVPSTEDVHKPYFKPLKDLFIKKIRIFEKEGPKDSD